MLRDEQGGIIRGSGPISDGIASTITKALTSGLLSNAATKRHRGAVFDRLIVLDALDEWVLVTTRSLNRYGEKFYGTFLLRPRDEQKLELVPVDDEFLLGFAGLAFGKKIASMVGLPYHELSEEEFLDRLVSEYGALIRDTSPAVVRAVMAHTCQRARASTLHATAPLQLCDFEVRAIVAEARRIAGSDDAELIWCGLPVGDDQTFRTPGWRWLL
jgi:hypothetical protein